MCKRTPLSKAQTYSECRRKYQLKLFTSLRRCTICYRSNSLVLRMATWHFHAEFIWVLFWLWRKTQAFLLSRDVMGPRSAACNLQEFFLLFFVCRYFYLIILFFCVDIFIQLFYLCENAKVNIFNHSSLRNRSKVHNSLNISSQFKKFFSQHAYFRFTRWIPKNVYY